MSFLRFLMLLSLVVWIGGIIFLSFVEAPTAFRVLPPATWPEPSSAHSLSILHWMGLFSGVIFLGCSMLSFQPDHRLGSACSPPRHVLVWQCCC